MTKPARTTDPEELQQQVLDRPDPLSDLVSGACLSRQVRRLGVDHGGHDLVRRRDSHPIDHEQHDRADHQLQAVRKQPANPRHSGPLHSLDANCPRVHDGDPPVSGRHKPLVIAEDFDIRGSAKSATLTRRRMDGLVRGPIARRPGRDGSCADRASWRRSPRSFFWRRHRRSSPLQGRFRSRLRLSTTVVKSSGVSVVRDRRDLFLARRRSALSMPRRFLPRTVHARGWNERLRMHVRRLQAPSSD